MRFSLPLVAAVLAAAPSIFAQQAGEAADGLAYQRHRVARAPSAPAETSPCKKKGQHNLPMHADVAATDRAVVAAVVTPKTTGTGVWQSTASATTIYITTASANQRCGAQFGTRTVCATPTASCQRIRDNFSTCKAATITRTTTTSRAPSSSAAPPASTGGSSSGGPTGGISDILVAHNKARASHNAPAMTWDDGLTSLAKTWAEKCVWHHGGANGAGQNLAAAAGQAQNGQAVVNAWMSEEKDYNPSNPTYSHFTQVVWKASTKLGCYQAKCPKFVNPDGSDVFKGFTDNLFTVCNYSPAGNYAGQYSQNVEKII